MKKPKITKGEWRVISPGQFDMGYKILLVETEPHIGDCFIATEIQQGKDEGKADAKLIAAAPNVAEALNLAYIWFKDNPDTLDHASICKSALLKAGYTES